LTLCSKIPSRGKYHSHSDLIPVSYILRVYDRAASTRIRIEGIDIYWSREGKDMNTRAMAQLMVGNQLFHN